MIEAVWLADAKSVHRGIVAIGVPPTFPDVANVFIRSMISLCELDSPIDFDDVADEGTLVPDGDWGANAQAAFTLLTYIAEHGDVPEEDSSGEDSDSDVKLDTSVANHPDDQEPQIFDGGWPPKSQ
ncbi:MAG: hypothetical protein A3C02_01310 [Candidatus Andersenbacteria bacterium RIFCSPHIGHO2_02_FULL_45_11]|uniref:Uncharacterized protein n=1 Tax=Candidatus Andersenbacteria bacterium RIFCSPHIGHO2_12_FULL_45_11 TaxID=1797281 RepID=A0A1G1X304_9BACT|nr:MAG: hypothetical protein A2805_00090 [Candidatus Andersenbacteria bacterium RIFCSPHIGHO2_01_FULL_46_36]OGY34363.1 MAG: hypothetical protein A3D99_02520 [Candidatus Andersenbacteria bacterium RIFCSPHIGHO2_12_FULL_45_11]OGY34942.1 MAG: hypothetical protein A3C02_01310 [Candidatus Andersenbacteria bacterium RIFCSPHIGHO2_02_FULL_45_11]